MPYSKALHYGLILKQNKTLDHHKKVFVKI